MTEMNISNTAEKVVTIPQTEFAAIIRDKAETATMLSNLIVMWKHEEKLKQHHRPYLHVRKETERMCDHYLKRLSEMSEHFKNGLHIRLAEPCAKDSVTTDKITVNGECAEKVIHDLAGDILTLMDYVDIQHNMISLLESGIEMDAVTEKFSRFLNKELDEMMERLDKIVTEYPYESE